MFTDRYTPYAMKIRRMAFRQGLPVGAADLIKDGQKIGLVRLDVEDRSTVVLYEFTTVRSEYEFFRHLAQLPRTFFDEALADTESAVGLYFIELFDAEHHDQALIKMCRQKTCFRLRGDLPDAWREADERFTADVASRLRHHYGDALELIANEQFGAGAKRGPGRRRAAVGEAKNPVNNGGVSWRGPFRGSLQ